MNIDISAGDDIRDLVDAFYERNGSVARARPDDVFFLAMKGDTLIGCVRYCVENDTPMLRTMRVDASYQRRGVGLALLASFAAYLDERNIRRVFCLPYSHLERFYGRIGFVRVPMHEVPRFLQERLHEYDPTGIRYVCMSRLRFLKS
jgi:N-acetylglutamate synthase-like GNAT family acetyltransferase